MLAPKSVRDQQQVRSRLKHQKLRISFFGYIGVLLFLALLQFIGVFFFAKGFLLSRLVLPDIATLRAAEPKFLKMVVLVVDALRFDFVVPVDRRCEKHNENYHNHFPVMGELMESHPYNSVLLKFMADPPTTTLQRLKGLTTGLLPTFIDAGSNFNGDAIDEDNWVLQLHRLNKSVAFMGDDTWSALFSRYIDPALHFPYDSLNVWDLHTVDNGVEEHLFPLLDAPHRWDVLIGHFLGVDHVGHRYGPDHHSMRDKLRQMDDIVRRVVRLLSDDTLLVVLGDHGMDHTGNHGGDSPDELESTLFLYSHKEAVAPLAPAHYNTSNLGQHYRKVDQIDLVPTLSLLLGLPIPHNNLGFPIDEMFSEDERSGAGRSTLEQIYRFQSKSKEFSHMTDFAANASSLLEGKPGPAFVQDCRALQRAFLDSCKSLWARFDVLLMSFGILVLMLSFIVMVTYSRSIPAVRVLTMSFEFIGSVIAMSLLGLVLSLSIYVVLTPHAISFKNCLLSGVALGITIGFWAPIMDRFSLPWLWHQMCDFFVYNLNSWSLLSLVFVVLHLAIFASNLYVIWEDKLVSFFIPSFGFCCLYGTLIMPLSAGKPNEKKIMGIIHSLTFIVLSRVVSMINSCREEQMPYCIPTFKTTRASVAALYVLAMLLPRIIKAFYVNLLSFHSAAPLWIDVGLPCLMLMNAVYWTLELLENDDSTQLALQTYVGTAVVGLLKLGLARLVLFVSLVLANFSWSRGPLCVRIEIQSVGGGDASDQGELAEEVLEKLRVEIAEDEALDGPLDQLDSPANGPAVKGSADTPDALDSPLGQSRSPPLSSPPPPPPQPSAVILGYGNVYGSAYFLLVINFSAAILLVMKPKGAISIGILMVQILTLLELYDVLGLRKNLIAPVMFGLLGYQHFFSTGHQATIPSIQWDVGFMTTQTILFPFTHLNIFLNTFGSVILVCMCVPLITVWRLPPLSKPITVLSQIVTNITTLITYQTLISVLNFIFAAHFRRHLMVWKIFAPRFMFSAMLLVVMNVVLIVVTFWFATGRVLKQVNRIFGK